MEKNTNIILYTGTVATPFTRQKTRRLYYSFTRRFPRSPVQGEKKEEEEKKWFENSIRVSASQKKKKKYCPPRAPTNV